MTIGKRRENLEYQCGVCKQSVSGDMMVFREHTEKHIVDLVKVDHPDWVETNGMCRKCFDYYRAELKGTAFHDAPCALRKRKLNKFVSAIKSIFTREKST